MQLIMEVSGHNLCQDDFDHVCCKEEQHAEEDLPGGAICQHHLIRPRFLISEHQLVQYHQKRNSQQTSPWLLRNYRDFEPWIQNTSAPPLAAEPWALHSNSRAQDSLSRVCIWLYMLQTMRLYRKGRHHRHAKYIVLLMV